MSNLFEQLGVIEEDQKRLESINRLQDAFNEVRASYSSEYNSALTNVLGQIKDKMKGNAKMCEAVNAYVRNYVKDDKQQEATEALYNMLAAEMVRTFQALSHTSCTIC